MSALAGAVAVVTGGASGIGQALCEALARCGARVVVAARNAAGADEVARAIAGTHGQAARVDKHEEDSYESHYSL